MFLIGLTIFLYKTNLFRNFKKSGHCSYFGFKKLGLLQTKSFFKLLQSFPGKSWELHIYISFRGGLVNCICLPDI